MQKEEEQPLEKQNSAKAAASPAELPDSTLPQVLESTVITNENLDDTRVDSKQIANSSDSISRPKLKRSQTELSGQVVSGKYAIEEKLGEGGMGSVFQAYDGMMKRVVAIKLLNQDRDASQETLMRFQQEAQATCSLDHINIVRVHDFSVCDIHGPYLVMDLVEGEPLSSLIARKQKLEPHFVADIMIQVADALQHAHGKGVIHRDLKPSNILVSTEGNVPTAKIVDFGIAKLQRNDGDDLKLTRTGEVFGSPLYMSPEQCLAAPLDRRSDIYSLGCVMYEALSGEPPFKGKNFAETVIMHTKESPKPFAQELQIPSALKRIVFCSLEKSPDDRYRSMNDLKKELQNFRKGLAVRVKQKKKFWKLAILACVATVPITVFFSLRDAVKEQPEFISTIFMKYDFPQIFEWLVLPDDETRTALNAVKVAMKNYKKHEFTRAESVLQGINDAYPDSNRSLRLTAWPMARCLARQGKYKEAEEYIKATYKTDKQVAMNLRIVGITLQLYDGHNEFSEFFFKRAMFYFEQAKEPVERAKCQYLLATYDWRAGKPKEAIDNLKSALPVLEGGEKTETWIKKAKDALAAIEAGKAPPPLK
ncbi:MAG: protein kinase [Candidatus Obscuribacterales bacterium]|nr:protein kinase [Candidatus Obscuribacterales bacterium]